MAKSVKIFCERDVWYVYLIIVDGAFYIGYHLGNNDFYGGSSSDASVKAAIANGTAQMCILWSGKNKFKAAALENYCINYAIQKGYKVLNKNRGASTMGNVLDEQDIAYGENVIDGKIDIITDDSYENAMIEKLCALRNVLRKKQVDYKWEGINTLYWLPREQVRDEKTVDSHLETIIEKQQMQGPEETKQKVGIVSLIVWPDGRRSVADKNHTIDATKKAEVITELPTFEIPSDFFDNSIFWIHYFGNLMNESEDGVVYLGNNRTQCAPAVREFYAENVELFNSDFSGWVRKFNLIYGKLFAEKTIKGAIGKFKTDIKESNRKGDNWIKYHDKHDPLYEEIVRIVSSMFPRFGQSNISGSSCERTVIANMVNYFANTAASSIDLWIGFIHHESTSSEKNMVDKFRRIENNLAFIGFHRSVAAKKYGIIPYVNSDGKTAFIVELPSRFDISSHDNLAQAIVDHVFKQ